VAGHGETGKKHTNKKKNGTKNAGLGENVEMRGGSALLGNLCFSCSSWEFSEPSLTVMRASV